MRWGSGVWINSDNNRFYEYFRAAPGRFITLEII